MPTFQTLPEWAQFALLIIPTVSTMFAAIGLMLTFSQSRRTNAQARSALVAECLKRFAEDEGIQRAFYAIEYSEFRYDEKFHGSDFERDIDRLLRHFSNIALVWQSGLLRLRDIQPIQYYVLRVVRDAEIQKYLRFIDRWSKDQKLGEHPYNVLNRLTGKLEK